MPSITSHLFHQSINDEIQLVIFPGWNQCFDTVGWSYDGHPACKNPAQQGAVVDGRLRPRCRHLAIAQTSSLICVGSLRYVETCSHPQCRRYITYCINVIDAMAMRADRQTDKQKTYKHADHNTSHHYRCKVIITKGRCFGRFSCTWHINPKDH